jgi:hypothetical protein
MLTVPESIMKKYHQTFAEWESSMDRDTAEQLMNEFVQGVSADFNRARQSHSRLAAWLRSKQLPIVSKGLCLPFYITEDQNACVELEKAIAAADWVKIDSQFALIEKSFALLSRLLTTFCRWELTRGHQSLRPHSLKASVPERLPRKHLNRIFLTVSTVV